jgi:hypothetical protein
LISRGWIDVTYGEEEMALLEEEVLPVLAWGAPEDGGD